MARDRCWSCRGAGRSLILTVLLTFDLLAIGVASDLADQSDTSRFHYRQLTDELSEPEPEFEFHLRPNPESLIRRRRMYQPPEVPAPGAQDHPQQSPAKPSPSGEQQPEISTRSNASSVSVPYSTAAEQNATSTGPLATGTTAKPNSTAKGVIVSTPIVPSTDGHDKRPPGSNATDAGVTPSLDDKDDEHKKVHVWANRTMWTNVTGNSGSGDDNESDYPALDKYPAEVTNKTLEENNITKSENDTHQYYNSTFKVDEATGKKYWVDLDNHPDLQTNLLLSQSHRRAATIKLKFDFPFYGHKVRNITIATGGFLYTGEYVHSWLAATQYIAPLMANFDTRLSQDSFVKYADNGTAFTVEWENVKLQDKSDGGAFTFQVTLLQNGDIIFVYSVIPVLVENIEDKEHPVKIGLSDAYMMDRTVFFARRKTIYEYHRVNFNRHDIKNWTVIYLKALPTCLQMENCNDCLTKVKEFDCKWCPELQKCSTGTFRFRQEWLQKGCDVRNVKEEGKCPTRSSVFEHVDARSEDHHHDDMPEMTMYSPNQAAAVPSSSSLENGQDNMNMGVSGVIGILFVVSLIAGLSAWAAYAYRNPHSASGQMLIRYRPSQWSWRRGEARYTAATIHM